MRIATVVLVFASILLLSGAWCIYLSPVSTVQETKLLREYFTGLEGTELGGDGYSSVTYPVDVEDRDVVTIRLDRVGTDIYVSSHEEYIVLDVPGVNIYLKDPDGHVIWSDEHTLHAAYSIQLASGQYTIEIANPSERYISCSHAFTVDGFVDYRPLEPVGSLLIPASLPVFCLGAAASIARRKSKEVSYVGSAQA